MNLKFEAAAPETIEFTLTATMTLGRWDAIRTSLQKQGDYASLDLRLAIGQLVQQAQQSFRPEKPKNE